jgi:hypothetical protein
MIEIKTSYWPATPNLREIKFIVNGKLELSVFCNQRELEAARDIFDEAVKQLIEARKNET